MGNRVFLYNVVNEIFHDLKRLFQIEYTNRILDSIQRGLILEVEETGIYASRQDRCHVFATTSDPSVAHPNPQKLPQNTKVELLSFDKYVSGKCGSFTCTELSLTTVPITASE